jgi:PAS domain S-box-containing protein
MKSIAIRFGPLFDLRARGGRAAGIATAAAACAMVFGLYFLSARLGLALLAQPEGVAVFWPASGIAAGLLVLLGRRATVPVALGVCGATIAANLLGDRNVPLALAFGAANAGEAVLFAWLYERRFDRRVGFSNLDQALCFFIAAAVSTGAMAFAAAAAITITGSAADMTAIWQAWWVADMMGVITVAPLFIALAHPPHEPLPQYELFEGSVIVVAIAVVAGITYLTPAARDDWWLPVPVASIFPLLLWAAAKCRGAFVAAGIMLVALIIVLATTHGLGHFGNPAHPFAERMFAARVTMASVAFCGLMLIAVFTDRRISEAASRASEQRFARLAAAAPGVIYTFRVDKDGQQSFPYASPAIAAIMGLRPQDVSTDAAQAFAPIHPLDIDQLKADIAASKRALTPFHAEFRYRHPVRGEVWLEANSNPVQQPDGAVVWHGFLQDVSSRKTADARVRMLLGELDHRAKNLLAVVQAVAFHTAAEESPAQFVDTFGQRIASLGASHDLLARNAWTGVALAALVESQLAHFVNLIGTRIKLDGPAVTLTPAAAQGIGMALHELATNASKYGALSSDDGQICIAWSRGPRLEIRWAESRGPAVTAPAKRGFGHKVMVEMLEYELDARVTLAYAETGLVWSFSAPTGHLIDSA